MTEKAVVILSGGMDSTTLLYDIKNQGYEVSAVCSSGKWVKDIEAAGIKVKIIFRESARKSSYVKGIPLAEMRFMPDRNSSPVAINIYGDKTAIILWTPEPVGILIKGKEIADGYRKYFEILWEGAKT